MLQEYLVILKNIHHPKKEKKHYIELYKQYDFNVLIIS